MGQDQITMYGTNWCGDCKRAKQCFGEQRVTYDFVDVDGNAEGLAVVERINQGKQIIPTIVFGDGSVLVEPSNAGTRGKAGTVGEGEANVLCADCRW